MELKELIENNDFIKDLIKSEAKELLSDLKNYRLIVVLMDAPDKKHEGQKIRVAIEHNIDWYKDLYWSSGETWKRNHTKKFLKEISQGKFNFKSKYVERLLSLILNRLGIEE